MCLTKHLAGRCTKDPAPATGEVTSNWNASLLTGTVFNYSCPAGKLFENTYSGQLENKCYSRNQNVNPDWLYGSNSRLPTCVGKISTILNILTTILNI